MIAPSPSSCSRFETTLKVAAGAFLCALTAWGCDRAPPEPLPIPTQKVGSSPKEESAGRYVPLQPATIDNALRGRTRGALHVKVLSATSDAYMTWLQVEDATGKAWAVVPPLAVTPTGDVTLKGWVRGEAKGPAEGKAELALWAAGIEGQSVIRRHTGEETVIDPVFSALEVTGTVAQSAVPTIAKAQHNIAELYGQSEPLAGTEVEVRGQVIHVIADLGGSTWWLLRDSSGAPPGSKALLVRMNAPSRLGEVVLVRGRLKVNERFLLTGPIPALLSPATLVIQPPKERPMKAAPAQKETVK